MSLTSSLATPVNIGIRSAHSLLRGGSLRSMARAVGVVMGAGLLAASYQLCCEEGRTFVHNMRLSSAHRRARNDALMLVLLNSKIPIETQDRLRRSRDAVGACMRLLTNPTLPQDQHDVIHAALTKTLAGDPQQD